MTLGKSMKVSAIPGDPWNAKLKIKKLEEIIASVLSEQRMI
jgi:hypothetical protein